MENNKLIENQTRGDERAYYGVTDTVFRNCVIRGDEDGESAFKECHRIELEACRLELRYPLWHVEEGTIRDCCFEENCRAPLWYCRDILLKRTEICGVKAVRECENVLFDNCKAVSAEFGWKTRGFTASNSEIEGNYLFLDSSELSLENVSVKGKYTFQYVNNAVIRSCVLDTKDAFWHAENVTVYDSVVKGEYLGWYSKKLRLVRCEIIGTQPLCYAEGLTLENCTMSGCDLSFEKSEVEATVIGGIDSVKNPKCGRITAGSVGEVISEEDRAKKTSLIIGNGAMRLI